MYFSFQNGWGSGSFGCTNCRKLNLTRYWKTIKWSTLIIFQECNKMLTLVFLYAPYSRTSKWMSSKYVLHRNYRKDNGIDLAALCWRIKKLKLYRVVWLMYIRHIMMHNKIVFFFFLYNLAYSFFVAFSSYLTRHHVIPFYSFECKK